MAVRLSKGQKIDLTKTNPNLKKIIIGLGWASNRSASSYEFDVDASAFLLGSSGRVEDENDFIFYNNPSGGRGSVVHSGDNKHGSSQGDAEQISINLSGVPAHVARIAFSITINDAQMKRQNFGQINNSYVRVINAETNDLLLQYDLGQDFSVETAIVAAEIYRHNGEWKFNAIGSGFQGGLAALCRNFGLEVEEEQNNNQSYSSSSHSNSSFGNSPYSNSSIGSNNTPANNASGYRSNSPVNMSQYRPNPTQSHGQPVQAGYSAEYGGINCPRCQSTQVTAGKKGFGIGKAAVGGLLLGPVGILAGFIGSKNMEFACRSCGERWNGATHQNTAQWLQRQTDSARNVVNKYMGQDLTEALVAGAALVSMADGILDPSEREKLLEYFRSSQEMRTININDIITKFNYFVQRLQFDFMLGKAEALRTIGKISSKPEAARLVVRLCCAIGYADGEFVSAEKRIVEEICRELYLDPGEFIY